MLLLTALGLALLYAIMKPLSDGLFDTSARVAKILSPTDPLDPQTEKQLMKLGKPR